MGLLENLLTMLGGSEGVAFSSQDGEICNSRDCTSRSITKGRGNCRYVN